MLLDLSHTSHSAARTGIQRVARAMHREFVELRGGTAIVWDPYARFWRPLHASEKARLEEGGAATKRGARWSFPERLAGRWSRWTRSAEPTLTAPDGLLVPEIFSPAVANALPRLFAKVAGPKVALFHDAIALRLPELSPPGTVGRFPGYLRELAQFDKVAAVSEDSRQSLVEFWQWSGVPNPPPVVTIPLGIDALPLNPHSAAPSSPPSARPIVLCVGTIEGRKNHVALLDACTALWASGLSFELHLIGLMHGQTGTAAKARIARIHAAGQPLRYEGPVDDHTLEAAYRACSFTVYPSVMEGFGLPVLESLARGRPCICSRQGALGESAAGGGCLTVEQPTADALREAIRLMITEPERRAALQAEAARRTFRTWKDYAADIEALMRG